MSPKKKSPRRKKITNAKKPAPKNTPKKIPRTSGSPKKLAIAGVAKKPSKRETAKLARIATEERAAKRAILASARQAKKREIEARRLRKNAAERARYRLKQQVDKRGVKFASDSKYWLERQTNNKPRAAKFTTKSIRTPRTTKSFRIRKKIKAIDQGLSNEEAIKVAGKGMKSFLKLKKKPKKKGKKTFIKLMLRAENGSIQWISKPREEFKDADDITDRLALLEETIKSERYVDFNYTIIGYEAEETV